MVYFEPIFTWFVPPDYGFDVQHLQNSMGDIFAEESSCPPLETDVFLLYSPLGRSTESLQDAFRVGAFRGHGLYRL